MRSFIQCSDPDRTLGFDAAKQAWFVAVRGQAYVVGDDKGQSMLAVLPFLELSLDEFEESVSELLDQYPGVEFPYGVFVRAGFEHGSPHWVDCALRWLRNLTWLHATFTVELEKVTLNKKRYSQTSRHLAKKILNRANSTY